MDDFKRSGGFGGDRGKPQFNNRGGGFGRPSFGNRGGRDGESQQRFQATCATCNKECEVPFRPTGDRPVYCSNCFRGKNDASPSDYGQRQRPSQSFDRRGPASTAKPQADTRIDALKNQIDSVSAKLDTLIQLVGEMKAGKSKSAKSAKPDSVKEVSKPVTKKKPASKNK